MTDNEQHKTCPHCAESIKAAAKICPHCTSRQGFFAVWETEIVGVTIVAFLATAAAFFVWLYLDHSGVDGRSFTGHHGDLMVIRTAAQRNGDSQNFNLTGYVTNSGNYPWRIQELEIRLSDPQGNLLDVIHSDVSEVFVVEPRQEHAFRTTLGKLSFTNSSWVASVRVQNVTDGNRPAKTD